MRKSKLQRKVSSTQLKYVSKCTNCTGIKWAPICITALVFMVHCYIYVTVNRIVPDPYMDEIFQVGQTQRYCEGNWNYWDNKLTTFPGLYIIAVVIRNVLKYFSIDKIFEFFSEYDASVTSCSTFFLRGVNALVFAPLSVYVIWQILLKIHGNDFLYFLYLRLIRVVTFPVFFFFHFLFYTDTASTFFVLLMYLCILQQKATCSGIVGLIAVLTRQTNIVWLCGAALLLVWQHDPDPSFRIIKSFIPDWLKRACCLRDYDSLPNYKYSFLMKILKCVYVHIACVLCFVVFFIINNFNVVLGDHEFHKPVRHLAQIVYLSGYLFAFSGVYFWMIMSRKVWVIMRKLILFFYKVDRSQVISSIPTEGMSVVQKYAMNYSLFTLIYDGGIGSLRFFSYFVVLSLFSWTGTIIHLFILSDNRHYVFYLWKYILRHNFVRIFLAPLCLAAFFEMSEIGENICVPMVLLSSRSSHKNELQQQVEMQNTNVEVARNTIRKFSFLNEVERQVYTVSAYTAASRRVYMLTFWLCSFIALVPTGLLELRYFMIPMILFLMHQSFNIESKQHRSNCFSFILNEVFCIFLHLILNAVVLYVFLYREFKSVDGNVARFIY